MTTLASTLSSIPSSAPAGELDALRSVLGVSQASIARMLGTTPRTVSRWRTSSSSSAAPRPATAQALRELGRLRWLLETDLGADAARCWIRQPNAAFRGEAPIDLLLRGERDRVLGLVTMLGEGGLF